MNRRTFCHNLWLFSVIYCSPLLLTRQNKDKSSAVLVTIRTEFPSPLKWEQYEEKSKLWEDSKKLEHFFSIFSEQGKVRFISENFDELSHDITLEFSSEKSLTEWTAQIEDAEIYKKELFADMGFSYKVLPS